MHKAVEYFNQIVELVGRGFPADWQQVARQMAMICAQTPQPEPVNPPNPELNTAPTPEPLPEPPL